MPLNAELIRRLRPQNEIHYFTSVATTMAEASALANAGAPHGTVVYADEQTAGLGRLSRTWISKPDEGLYSSTLLILPISGAELPLVTLVLGLSAADAIHRVTNLMCDLRWPNDVLIGGRKAAGILAQLVGKCVVAGIGINVDQSSFPHDLRWPATSLRMETGGHPPPREALAVALLESIDSFCEMLVTEGSNAVVRAFTAASSYAVDRRVQIEESGRTGTTAGLDEHGFLKVRYDDGTLERIAAGGVRPLEA